MNCNVEKPWCHDAPRQLYPCRLSTTCTSWLVMRYCYEFYLSNYSKYVLLEYTAGGPRSVSTLKTMTGHAKTFFVPWPLLCRSPPLNSKSFSLHHSFLILFSCRQRKAENGGDKSVTLLEPTEHEGRYKYGRTVIRRFAACVA